MSWIASKGDGLDMIKKGGMSWTGSKGGDGLIPEH